MQFVRWFFIALPFVGLAWVVAEAMVRDRRALVEMALDSEAFARMPTPPLEAKKPGPARSLPGGVEVHG